jgi:hypothetical protein
MHAPAACDPSVQTETIHSQPVTKTTQLLTEVVAHADARAAEIGRQIARVAGTALPIDALADRLRATRTSH